MFSLVSSTICAITSVSYFGNDIPNIIDFSFNNGNLTILSANNSGSFFIHSIYSYDLASNQSTLMKTNVSFYKQKFTGQKGKPSGI